MIDTWNVPKHWTWLTLNDVAEWGSGGTPKSNQSEYYGGEIPWLIIADLNDGIVKTSAKTITELGLKNSSAKMVQKGSILVAMYGSIGKLGIAGMNCTTNQAIAFTKTVIEKVEPQYLFYYLFRIKQNLLELGRGGAQPNISQTLLKQVEIPLPPLNEQKRIAAKLDRLLTKVNEAKERLDRIPTILKRFRQSVLYSACSGKLTADWREKHPDIEPSSDNLIFTPKFDDYDIGELPFSWVLSCIDNIATVKGGKRLPKGEKLLSENTGYPYIRAGNLKNGTVITEDLLFITEKIRNIIKNYTVASGDVYITIVGACIGDAGIIPDELKGANLTENAAKICNFNQCNNQYLAFWLRSPYCQEIIRKNTLSAAQGKLALTRIKTIPVPLPPLEEQKEIVRRVEALLKKCDIIEERYLKAKAYTDKLTSSILAKAFRGELVPQDPNDEPAELLLERISAEKVKTDPKRKIMASKGKK